VQGTGCTPRECEGPGSRHPDLTGVVFAAGVVCSVHRCASLRVVDAEEEGAGEHERADERKGAA
jgi:hypothetical protein